MKDQVTFAILALLLEAQPILASELCARHENSIYCRNGERREVCAQGGYVVWADSRAPISLRDANLLSVDGPLPEPSCRCWDLNQHCVASGRIDCAAVYFRCNTER